MARDGFDIAAHGVRHDDLSQMNAAQQRYQIANSVHILSTFLHAPILSYAYPSGSFNRTTLSIVRQEGIPLAVTTDASNVVPPENRFELTRVRVRGAWSLKDFATAINGALSTRHAVVQ